MLECPILQIFLVHDVTFVGNSCLPPIILLMMVDLPAPVSPSKDNIYRYLSTSIYLSIYLSVCLSVCLNTHTHTRTRTHTFRKKRKEYVRKVKIKLLDIIRKYYYKHQHILRISIPNRLFPV